GSRTAATRRATMPQAQLPVAKSPIAAPKPAKPRQSRAKRAGIPSQRASTRPCTTGPGTVSSAGAASATEGPQLGQKRALEASSSPPLRHSLSLIGDALMPGFLPTLQSTSRIRGPPVDRPHLCGVLVLRVLAGAMVELEPLQRRK